MSKTPSDRLFRLVRSLTPHEKRYFRIYIRGKTERNSKYLQLFEALEEMPCLDEELLKTKIYGSQEPEGKKYSELKAYLYDLLLKCLQTFDENHSTEQRIKQLLEGVAVLYKRGAYEDCRDLLHKALKLARKHEHFSAILDILRWEKQIAYTLMDIDYLHTQLERIEADERLTLGQLNNLTDYRRAFFEIYTFSKRDIIRNQDDRHTALLQLVNRQEMLDEDAALSHRGRVMRLRVLNLYYYALQDIEHFFDSGRILIRLIESKPHILRENLTDYIAALSNYLMASGLKQRFDEVRTCLEKLRQLKPLTADDRLKIHRQYYNGKFALCQATGEFEEGREEMERCLKEAEELNDMESSSFYFQYFYLCFGAGDYDGASDYLNRWLAMPRTVAREDLQTLSRILQLALHYELDNLLLMESLIRSTKRFLKQKNRLYALERRFLHLMSDLIKAPSPKERKEAFEKMQTDWPSLPGAEMLEQTFDLAAWIDCKVSGESFAHEVRRKWETKRGIT